MLSIFKQYYPIRKIFFVMGEGIIIYVSVLAAGWIHSGTLPVNLEQWLCLKSLLIAFVCLVCLYYNNLYDLNITERFSELGLRLLQSLGAAAILLSGIYFIFSEVVISTYTFVISIGFILIFVVSWRFCYTIILNRGIFTENIILVGSGELARSIIYEITNRKDCGCVVIAVGMENREDDNAEMTNMIADNGNIKILSRKDYDILCELSKNLNIKKIVVALKEKRGLFPTNELLQCRVKGVEILEGNTFYEMLTGRLLVDYINPSWIIFSEGFRKSRIRRLSKRIADIIFSLIILIFLFPLILIVTILIRLDSKGPVLFSQERVGKEKKIYRIHKFRSMFVNRETHNQTENNDPRITRVGKYIRVSHIDEIPQFWNVLKGEMSIVGPRPEQENFVNQFENEYKIPYYRERFTVKPGITGWAQINCGYGDKVDGAKEKLSYDLFYIKNMSVFMDLMIILRTVKTVIFGEGR